MALSGQASSELVQSTTSPHQPPLGQGRGILVIILDIQGSVGTGRPTPPFSLTSELLKILRRGLGKEQLDMSAWEGTHGVRETVIKISSGPALPLSGTWVMFLRVCRGSSWPHQSNLTRSRGQQSRVGKSELRPKTHILVSIVHSVAAWLWATHRTSPAFRFLIKEIREV